MPRCFAEVDQAPNKICTLQVCPNNSQYNRANLRALMAAIAKTHAECRVRVFDTLAFHTFVSMGYSHELSMDLSKKRGDEWVKRYLRYQKREEYAQVLSSEVLGWDEVKALPSFKEKLDLADWAYKNTEVKCAIDQYVDRHVKQAIAEERLHAEVSLVADCSRSYILEELAGKAALVTDVDRENPYEVYSGHNAIDPALFERISKKHGVDFRVHNYLNMTIYNVSDQAVA